MSPTAGETSAEDPERDRHALESLQRITDAALSYLSLEDLLNELLLRVTEILRSDTAAFLLLDEGRQELVARAAKGIEEEVEQGTRIPVGKGFAGRIAAQRRPIFIEDVDHADILNPILRQKGIRSLLGVPLLVEGHVVGVLHVGSLVPRIFTDEDADLLQRVAGRAALAIDHAQSVEQRRLVEALQRTLLPDPLPRLPGIELAARYLPAAVATRIGGDWYDAFRVGGGRAGLAIGDVMGRGVTAATLMAQLRTALRVHTLDGHGPTAVAERLNRLIASIDEATMATFVYIVVDAEREVAHMVNAGHPPPLLVGPDGRASFVESQGDPPLGVVRALSYHLHEFAVPTGSTIVLVTDGAIEVPGESLDLGLERLRAIAERDRDLQRLCSAVARGEASQTTPADDVAIIAMHIAPIPERLETTWPADAQRLADVRHLLRRWLHLWTADTDEIYDVTVAVQEACANAVEHAYGPGGGTYEVLATHEEAEVTVTVRDHGGWRDPRGEHRGRGLQLMEALMDHVDVLRADDGTSIVLRRRLGRGHRG
jgi:serine phosphatase RsbU (regulator of sigma subunit)/anti-sigma regulatory factor (Ser/Thr protein kinase)